jgi:Tfp pilus assembly protein PilV
MNRPQPREAGLTLVEVLISVVILSLITGALSSVFVTAFNGSRSNTQRVRESSDAQTIAAYLVRDAQAAGGVDPSTAVLDPSLGVSLTNDASCTTATPGAALRMRFKWLDRRVDPVSNLQVSTGHVANYYWVPSSGSTAPHLERTTCVAGGAMSTLTLGRYIASVAPSCDPLCDSAHPLPDTVSLAMTATNDPVNAPAPGYQYTVTASLRPESQTPPCSVLNDPSCPGDTGTSVPLLALGGNGCVNGAVGASVAGSTTVHIYGGVIVDTADAGNCPALDFNGNPTYTSGTVSILNGGTCSGCPFSPTSLPAQLLDPFAGLTPPADTCGSGSNPVPTTVNGVLHYPAATYPTALTINDTNVVFDSGTFVFCAGLTFNAAAGSAKLKSPLATNANAIGSVTVDSTSGFNTVGGTFLLLHGGYPYYFKYTGISGATLTGVSLVAGQGSAQFALDDPVVPAATSGPGGVLFYVKGGTISKLGGSSVALSPQTSGPYAGLVIWQRALDTTTPMTFQGNGPLNINGTLYAPSIEVQLLGTVDTAVKSIVAATVTFGGNHTVGVGAPPPPLAISGPASLPNSTVGVPYPSTTVTATGGSGSDVFNATGLPNGLSINSVTGVISGTPSASGTFNVAVTDTDSFGDIATKPYTFTINPAAAISSPATLPDWTINRDYPGTAIVGTGGTTPYAWSAANLPSGLSINASTGVVSGTPTATGTLTATITLTDARGATATRNYSVTIHSSPNVTGPSSLPDWTANSTYPNQTMTSANGTTPYTWSASGLPPGVVISSTGVISGKPTTAGTYNVAVTLQDTAGAVATKSYTVTINPAPGIATGSLPNGEQNQPYSFTLTPTPGTPPYTWSSGNGSNALPPGLVLNTSTGVISGTPTTVGSYNTKITVTDATGASSSKTYTFVIATPVSISGPPSLQSWTVNRDYPGTAIIATNGVSPYVWSSTGLPNGLGINSSTGVVSGTPTASGTFNATVTVTDAAGGSASRAYTVVINANPVISTASLPNPVQGVAYSTTIDGTLGTPFAGGGFNWSVSGLPIGSGLSINSTTGLLSGTSNLTGTFSVTITAQDAAGATASKTFALTITPAPTMNSLLPNALPQGATNQIVTVSGADFVSGAQVTFSGTGITVNSTTFVDAFTLNANVSIGATAATGLRNVTVINPDTSSSTFTNAFTVNIRPTVASTSPSSRGQGATNQNVTVTGSNFVNGAQASFSGAGITVNSTTFVDASTLTANITIAAGAATGGRNVAVVNPDGGSGTGAGLFTVNAAPTVTSVAPNTAVNNTTSVSETITGTGFQTGATVTFTGGAQAPVVSSAITVNGAKTTLTFTISVPLDAGAPTVYGVTVANPDGGVATLTNAFTVT